jgi:methyl-accepting chemotaxis protein
MTTSIDSVTQAAAETESAATQVLDAAGDLSVQSETLRAHVDEFMARMRAE